MAILFLESFDDSLWSERLSGSGRVVDAAYGLHGNGLRLGDTYSAYTYVPCDPVSGTAIMGMAIKINSSGSGDRELIELGAGGTEIFYDSTNKRLHSKIQISSVAYTEDWTPVNSVYTDRWHFIEFKWYHNTSSAGTFQMGVDGTYTTQQTSIDYFQGFSNVRVGWVTVADVASFYVDDLYVADTTGGVNDDFLGPIAVTAKFPNGNGNSSVLVGQDADSTDNYLNVDEDPPDDGTTYNESGTEGDKDTYAMEDITGSPTVVGVVSTLYARRTQTGAKYARTVARVNSTDYVGATKALGEGYSPVENVFDQNPDTSTAWTQTTFNGAEFGPEVRD